MESLIPELASLRLIVFREWPYLYGGTEAEEADYLGHYAACPEALLVTVEDKGRIVGASTAMPLVEAHAEFRAPFERGNWDPATVFYFGESVLLPEYRGQGLGKRFMHEREAHARRLGGFSWTAFCSVQRPLDHPRRPTAYQSLDGFWEKTGFTRRTDLQTQFTWRDLDQPEETAKPMVFWLKPLSAH